MATLHNYPSSKGILLFCLLVFFLSTTITSAQFRLVIDLDPAAKEWDPQTKDYSLHVSDGTRSFFAANSSELWTSDGTTAGTRLIKRFVFIREIEVINAVAYFSAQTEDLGMELWKSDGTPAGTVLLKDLYPGRGSGNPLELTNMNGTLYFSANNNTNGRELWKSNGSVAGTLLVKDIVPGSGWSHPERLVAMGTKLFFNARTAETGLEIWTSDGTSSGTELVQDVNPGPMSSYPWDLTASNGWLFFTAQSPYVGRQLCKTRGKGTTSIVSVINGGMNNRLAKLIDVSGQLFFQADDGTHGTELWRSDGTIDGTYMVKDLTPGPGSNIAYAREHLEEFASVNGKLFFLAVATGEASNLWMSDGTAAGTKQLHPESHGVRGGLLGASPTFYEINGAAYFIGAAASDSAHLCRIDMDGNISIVRKNISPTYPMHVTFARIGGNHYFMSDEYYWRTDGTSSGTTKFRTLGYPAGSHPYLLSDAGESMYFQTLGPDALWKTNGTASSTTKVMDNSKIYSMRGNNDLLFIYGDLDNSGPGPWRTDGSPEGTYKLSSTAYSVKFFYPTPDVVYFPAYSNAGEELWITDGTVAGTRMIDVVPGYESSGPRDLVPIGNNLFFTAATNSYGRELWFTNGTTVGTHLVKDIYPGQNSSTIQHVTSFKGKLFFQATDGVGGNQLWQSDGSNAGTFMVKEIPGENGNDAHYGAMAATNDWLFFSTATFNSPGTGALWKSDGTSAGTTKIKAIESAVLPSVLASMPSQAFFLLPYGSAPLWESFELWRTNGTSLVRLATFRDQQLAIGTEVVAVKGNTVYFVTQHAQTGTKFLWRTDGTVGGTYEIPFQGQPERLETSGDYVYLSGRAQKEGSELFIIEESVSAASEPAQVTKIVTESEDAVTNYPNPFEGMMLLSVKGDKGEMFSLDVIGSDGVSVQVKPSLSCNTDHQVGQDWAAGLYILRIRKGNNVITRKLIKVKD